MEKAYIVGNKITGYLLRPGTAHYQEFVDVGYSINDPEQLKTHLLTGVKTHNAIERKPSENGSRKFQVDMELGVTKKKLFRTGWQIDAGTTEPRFITAYRIKEGGMKMFELAELVRIKTTGDIGTVCDISTRDGITIVTVDRTGYCESEDYEERVISVNASDLELVGGI
ncbi:MAG: hypothetical protein LUH51_05360 [Firmicutes bacterium]|nr:hypothetical protein [Bacillota bacterium]